MSLGVRGKLFAISLALIAAVVLASTLFLEWELRGSLGARIEAELGRHARTAASALELSGDARVDVTADRLGETTATRVTVVGLDGRLRGDSELTEEELHTAEWHGGRPEIRDALAGRQGTARRYSTTLRTELLYVAVPLRRDGRVVGAVRAAIPLSEVDEAITRLRLLLGLAALLGLGAAVFMSGVASELMSRALRDLVKSAKKVAKGKRKRLPLGRSDELGRLAGSFQRMSDELERTVGMLASERNRLETVLEGMGEGVLALDADERITLANTSAQELLGTDRSPIGRSLLETARVPALAEMVRGGRATRTAEIELPGEAPLQVAARVAPLAHGGWLLVLHDVTEMRRLETVRRDFVANVSHELRTPVSVIRANAETLLDGALSDTSRAQGFVEAIHRNAERLTALIADLLDLSSIEAGQYSLRLEAVPVASLVEQTITEVAERARDKDITVASRVDAGVRARADVRALEQVLSNLLDNAVKYTQPGGHVTVAGSSLDGRVRLEVEDDGPGLEPKHRRRVFERFYRVDAGRSREMGGTGLGLSICKHLCESMGGRIGVEPGDGRGSIFWVELPAHEAP